MDRTELERTLASLPEELRREVADFAAFLLARHAREARKGTGSEHPLAGLAGAWRDEPLTDEELLPARTLGRPVDL